MVKKWSAPIKYSRRVSLNIVEQGHVEGKTEWRYHNVSSPFHRLYYILSGTIYVRDHEKAYPLKKGELWLMPKDSCMDYYATDDFEKYYFHLNYYGGGGRDLLDGCLSPIKIETTPTMVKQLMTTFHSDDISNFLKGQSALYEVGWQVIEKLPEDKRPRILKEMAYSDLIEEMIMRQDVGFSVEEMAEFCEQSISDFSRKFKKAIGMAPKHFMHSQLIEAAKMKLLTSDVPVKVIATELGFEDSLYFSRFFKKNVGQSPSTYRLGQMNLE